MKILITGSSGFIGSALVRALVKEKETVGALDKVPSAQCLGAAESYQCDILDQKNLRNCVQEFRPEVVIHLAARADLDGRRIEEYAANTTGVQNLISAVSDTPAVRRVIWTSSQMVCRPGYPPRHELDYRPHTVYGQSKVLTESIVRQAQGAQREWCIVRPTTVWGPGMSPHYQRLLRMIETGRYFHVGSGPYFKSYGYIDNVVHQYRMLMRAPAKDVQGRTFYVADYEPLDLVAWCDALQEGLGAPRIRHLPKLAGRLLARCGDVINALGMTSFPFNTFRLTNVLTEYRFDMQETAAVCGRLPVSFGEGVAATVKWYKGLKSEQKSRPGLDS